MTEAGKEYHGRRAEVEDPTPAQTRGTLRSVQRAAFWYYSLLIPGGDRHSKEQG